MYKYSLIAIVLLVVIGSSTAQENHHNYAKYSHNIVSADVHQNWEYNENSHQKQVNELVLNHYDTYKSNSIRKSKKTEPLFDFWQDNSDLDQEGEEDKDTHKEHKKKSNLNLDNNEIKKQIQEEVDRIISLKHLEESISEQKYKNQQNHNTEHDNHYIDTFHSNYYPTDHIEIQQESIYNDDYDNSSNHEKYISSEQVYNRFIEDEIDSHPDRRFFYP